MVAHGRRLVRFASNHVVTWLGSSSQAMFQHLTSSATIESARQHIAALIREHAEWFCTQSPNETYALRRNEIDVASSQGRLILSCWTEKGSRSWRILAWSWNGQTLILQ